MFCLGQGENRQVDVESHDRFYPVYYYKEDMRNLATVKHGTLKYQEGKDKVTFSIFFHKIYSKENECHPISICLYQHWDKQSWVFSSNEKIGSFVKYCMLLYETIKRLDGTDEIDTSKPISKKIGNWVRPLTPSEKKQQKKKQLFNTLNKKEKEILQETVLAIVLFVALQGFFLEFQSKEQTARSECIESRLTTFDYV